MSNPQYFRSRAAEYRQLAKNSQNEIRAGNLFEVANLFNCMADDLIRLEQLSCERARVIPIFQLFRNRNSREGQRTRWQSGMRIFWHVIVPYLSGTLWQLLARRLVQIRQPPNGMCKRPRLPLSIDPTPRWITLAARGSRPSGTC
jgi:hypothetical protein